MPKSNVLMVAEKPSIADTVSWVLSKGNRSSHKNYPLPVHEFSCYFPMWKEDINVIFTSVTGHVYTCDFPGEYSNWQKTDPSDLFNARIEKKESNPKVKLPGMLTKLCKSYSIQSVCLWLDCDREGENICFEILSILGNKIQYIYRPRFSSLVDKDIIKAFNEYLHPPNLNESEAVDARQEMDLKIGVAFSRFQTLYFSNKYGDLDSKLISYGPCQIPTLFFVVDRFDKIASFTPVDYYSLEILVKLGMNNEIQLKWTHGQKYQITSLDIISSVKQGIQSKGSLVIQNVSKKEEKRVRPKPLNTVSLLKLASKALGLGPHQAMHVAERLYLQGYTTYPRTETDKYASSFDTRHVINFLTDFTNGYNLKYVKPRNDGKDVGDHPPITPVKPWGGANRDTVEYRVYSLISKHFINTVCSDAIYSKIEASLIVPEGGISPFNEFALSETVLVDPGFLQSQGDHSESGSRGIFESISGLNVGDIITVDSVNVVPKKTSPPSLLSEADLLELMDKNGIGTDASMAVHINNICERKYVEILSSGRKLKPTTLGIALIHGLLSVDPELVEPKVRANIENQCDLIAKGKAQKSAVLIHTLSLFSKKFNFFRDNIDVCDRLFESNFTKLVDSGRPLSRCGHCKRYLFLINTKPMRLFCRNCDVNFNLPNNASSVKLYKELTCPLDNFELVMVNTRSKSHIICCPWCFNHPPKFSENIENVKNMTCSNCYSRDCSLSISNQHIFGCPKCPNGIVYLDTLTPPKFKLVCNSCEQLNTELEGIKQASLDGFCTSCSSRCLRLKTLENQDLSNYCLICDTLDMKEKLISSFKSGGSKSRKGKKGKNNKK